MAWRRSHAELGTIIVRTLGDRDVMPVLIDIGASGGPPDAWQPLGPAAHYIGFDPDLREMREEYGGEFARTTKLTQAVVGSGEDEKAEFFLTSSPFCSSMLEPDHAALDAWAFHGLFDVVKKTQVPTTTVDRALDHLDQHCVDWMKLDTQGTDLRIIEGLSDSRRSKLMAVDIEPGLIDAYVGEDLFVDAHRALTNTGFWLSRLDVQGSVRVGPQSRQLLTERYPGGFSAIRRSPGWCEARYLRRPDSISWASEREPLLLWAFSAIDEQFGAAIDVLIYWRENGGPSDIVDTLLEATVTAAGPALPRRLADGLKRWTPDFVRRAVRRIAG